MSGRPGDGLDQFDGVAELLVGLAQGLPLVHRQWVSTGVEVSIHGLMAYSTAKKVGRVIA